MADKITVVELPKPGGMSRDWPQPYEITVKPGYPGGSLPALPFLHKEDGITVEDGTTYWITSARQASEKGTSGIRWFWVYKATRDTSNDPVTGDEWPFDGRPL
jgi:hypothetical protein